MIMTKTSDAAESNLMGDRLVSKSTAALKLGVSRRTIDRLVQKGLLERVFVGAARRFRMSELDQIVESGR